MARNADVEIAANTWVQLTNGDVTALTFQNLAGGELRVKATAGATPPTDDDGSIRYGIGEGESNIALADLFPGVAGANRVYGYMPSGGTVMVSHA